jgi:hypothetical protein
VEVYPLFKKFREKLRLYNSCVCVCVYVCVRARVWAMDWTIGVLGFDSRRGLGIFLFTTASRTALGPTQPPVPAALFQGVKRPGREADHSPSFSAGVKNA